MHQGLPTVGILERQGRFTWLTTTDRQLPDLEESISLSFLICKSRVIKLSAGFLLTMLLKRCGVIYLYECILGYVNILHII